MDTKDLFKCIQETGHKENCDVTIKCRNGKVHTTKLILASWSTFWKEILLGFSSPEDITIVMDSDKLVLNKMYNF